MGYAHTFYAIDLERLRELHGSADATFAEELFAAKAEEIEDNDAFFDDAIDEGEVPDTCQALRDILSGEVR